MNNPQSIRDLSSEQKIVIKNTLEMIRNHVIEIRNRFFRLWFNRGSNEKKRIS